jgi:hypothetical protein
MSLNPEETEKYVYMITSATEKLNRIDKTLWQLFKQKYEEHTKQSIPYDLDDIQDFINASLQDDNFKNYISSYMDFSITWIATRIIDTLAQAIEEISTLNEQDIDLKSKFVIFDRMIKQLSELIKIKNKIVSEDEQNNKKHRKRGDKDYTRLLS